MRKTEKNLSHGQSPRSKSKRKSNREILSPVSAVEMSSFVCVSSSVCIQQFRVRVSPVGTIVPSEPAIRYFSSVRWAFDIRDSKPTITRLRKRREILRDEERTEICINDSAMVMVYLPWK
uniref:(northern house mosquito) hypothetical protein n=1 Tax=Culex pipiens TaxID=7175 RepID=A0A8D8AYF1_CULPI